MHNDFVLIGPETDPAAIRGMTDAAAALGRIQAVGGPFVSRGDNSGTHVKEQSLWRVSGAPCVERETSLVTGGKRVAFTTTRPSGDWYHAIGQGMGNTIRYATEKRAYTLVDRGTYLAFARSAPPRTDLVILCQGDARLANPYSVIAVNPEKWPRVQADAAARYVAWLTSPPVQDKIAAFKVNGETLFHPDAWPGNDHAPAK